MRQFPADAHPLASETRRPRVSFVTALYNRCELTREMLSSLQRTVSLHDKEVILVDNASTDDTRKLLSSLPSPFRVFRNEQNEGFAQANNFGVKEASATFVVLLNNDLVLKPGWLEPMLSLLQLDNAIGAVGNVQYRCQTNCIEHAGVFFDLDGMPTHARKHSRRPPKAPYLCWNAVTAACVAVRRDVFLQIGGFDQRYWNGMEDIDLCVRLRLAGYLLAVANTSIIEHHVSQSPGRFDRDEQNAQRFSRRWRSTTRQWGEREWALEYLRRYAPTPWRVNPRKLCIALARVTASLPGIFVRKIACRQRRWPRPAFRS